MTFKAALIKLSMSRFLRLVMSILTKGKLLMGGTETEQCEAMNGFIPVPHDAKYKQNMGSPTGSVDSRMGSPNDQSDSGREQVKYFLKMSLIGVLTVAMAFGAVMMCKDYIKLLLLWMEKINLWLAAVLFAVCFTIVSFPMTWGYILLNVAAGYIYGLFLGSILVVVCAFIGVFIAHQLTKRFLNDYVLTKVTTNMENETLRAILRVIEGGRGFKVVSLARLTPIPFGLQNGIFAISNIRCVTYFSATAFGCLPTQVLNCYIGTTLRSMEEVFKDNSTSFTAYTIFIGQLLLTVVLSTYVVRRARRELNKTVEELDTCPAAKMEAELSQNQSVLESEINRVYLNGNVGRHFHKKDVTCENNYHTNDNQNITILA